MAFDDTTVSEIQTSGNAILVAFAFFLVSFGIRLVDIFVIRLDETPFSIITSKVIPIILILIYLRYINRSVCEVGVHTSKLWLSVVFGMLLFIVFDGLPITVDLIMMVVVGAQPTIALAQIDSFLATYLLGLYIINSFMEEGIFRGLMMRQFMTKMSANKANLLQSVLFGLWHIVWPLKEYITGSIDFLGFVGDAFMYVLMTFLTGLIFGYMYQKSGSIIGPVVFHTLHNLFVSFIVIDSLIPEAADTVGVGMISLFILLFAPVLAIIFIRKFTKWAKQPDIVPWNQTMKVNRD